MSNNVANKHLTKTKKAYRSPQLKPLGSVQELTLKLGSAVDASDPSNPTFS